MLYKLCFSFLTLHMFTICMCTKETNGKREGFKSRDQEVVIVSPASVSVAENATSWSADKANMASGIAKTTKKSKKRVSAAKMMDSLQKACSNLRRFAAKSKYAQDVMQGNISAEMLSRELKQLEGGEPCGFTPYSAALKVFLKTCTIIKSCPFPSSKPTYNFKLPKAGQPKNGEYTHPGITQLYVVVPTVFSPGTVNLNDGSRNGGSLRRTVMNYANLPASLPSWFPVSPMMQMQQATFRAVASRFQQRRGGVTGSPVPGTTPETDAVD